jgi:hypothetical protein
MAFNTPEVQILSDGGQTSIVKIAAIYNTSNTANVVVINPKNLAFANTSQNCRVSISKIEYSADIGTTAGAVQLYWEGTTNASIMSFSSSNDGMFDQYLTNNATAPTGNIGVGTYGVGSGDTYNFILYLNKEAGFSNAFIAYNDITFKP